MHVHCLLKPRPEQHVRAVDVAVRHGGFLPLELKCKALVQADGEQDAETVVRLFDEGFCEFVAEGEGRGKDLLEMAGDGLKGGGWREEGG